MPYGVYHLLTCVLAVVMAVLVVLVSQRAEEKWYLKLDVSPSGVTNLSDYTLSRLHALDEDVLLYPVYTSGYDSTVRDLVTETLNKMSAECAHVRVETIDPVTQPQRIAALSGDAGSIENGTVFITNQDDLSFIDSLSGATVEKCGEGEKVHLIVSSDSWYVAFCIAHARHITAVAPETLRTMIIARAQHELSVGDRENED